MVAETYLWFSVSVSFSLSFCVSLSLSLSLSHTLLSLSLSLSFRNVGKNILSLLSQTFSPCNGRMGLLPICSFYDARLAIMVEASYPWFLALSDCSEGNGFRSLLTSFFLSHIVSFGNSRKVSYIPSLS